MNKKLIRLTESDLHRIVKESVRKVVKEDINPQFIVTAEQVIDNYYNNFETALKHLKETLKLVKVFSPIQLDVMGDSGSELLSQIPLAIESVKDAYGRISGVVSEMDDPSDVQHNEPEDWYERNEHGDFDSY